MSSTAQALHVSCRTFAPRHWVETESTASEGLEESESRVLRVLRVEHFCEGSSVEQDVEVERRVQKRVVRKPTEMVPLSAASSPTHRCQSLPDAAASSFLWTNAGKPRRRRRWTRRCQDQDGDLGKVRKHVVLNLPRATCSCLSSCFSLRE